MKTPVIVIGGGLSGLAAAIRVARFSPEVLLLEQHFRLGGLNSYYYRDKSLYETGLHAITNYSQPKNKKAPLNRLFRQLKLRREQLALCEQNGSKILFKDCESLSFTNDFNVLEDQIAKKFSPVSHQFKKLVVALNDYDPFIPRPFQSARKFLCSRLRDPLLVEMLLCPLMYYGSSVSDDMDLGQFVIMFRSIFQEGLCRPEDTIREFLTLLENHYLGLGGTIRTRAEVTRILRYGNQVQGVILSSGEEISCEHIISTVGHRETLALLGKDQQTAEASDDRLCFFESIFRKSDGGQLGPSPASTIIFYNGGDVFSYKQPQEIVDLSSAVFCFPGNFNGLPENRNVEFRTTHLANHAIWQDNARNEEIYRKTKRGQAEASLKLAEGELGISMDDLSWMDSYTPLTISRYTGKYHGAIYGSRVKIKDGDIGFNNLFLAGTDQGFLGIVGSMLSGVSIANQHVLPKL